MACVAAYISVFVMCRVDAPRLEMTASPAGRLQERDAFRLTCTADASPDHVTWRYVILRHAQAAEYQRRCHGVDWGGRVHPTFFPRVFLGLSRCGAY